jgi:ribosomal protein S18 acetylase RimI-like enzyme
MGALKRALEHGRNIASVAVVVDAIDENARAFYRRYGFIDVSNHTNRLFLLMKTVAQLFPDVD